MAREPAGPTNRDRVLRSLKSGYNFDMASGKQISYYSTIVRNVRFTLG
jgi:hypothetical protein